MREARDFEPGKRYNTYNAYLRGRYGGKVGRVALSGGFTCPNRDGSKGTGGCAFCSGAGSGEFAGDARESIRRQFEGQARAVRGKWGCEKFIAYFQSFSATYAPAQRLDVLYGEAISQPGVVGLNIATRADCVGEDVVRLLRVFSKKTDLTVELGLQSAWDETTRAMGCAHTRADFERACARLQAAGISVCAHIINGLPGESPGMMVETARFLSRMRIDAVKIHMLYAVDGTRLGQWAKAGRIRWMSREEYVRVVCAQLEALPAQAIIQRLTGDGPRDSLIAPLWTRDKRRVLGEIDKELRRRESWQGCKDAANGGGV